MLEDDNEITAETQDKKRARKGYKIQVKRMEKDRPWE